jgi:hypothetical protein
MSLANVPQLGSKPVALNVKLPPPKVYQEPLLSGLQELFRTGQFTDVVFLCAEQRIPAHRVVLACQSSVFKEALQSAKASDALMLEIRLDVPNPEAVKFMLDFLYNLDDKDWAKYNPRTQEINRDVLRLAQQFQLPGLTQRATSWLAKDLTTGNVVERLSLCDEFGLTDLSDRILETLTSNRQALAEVAHSPQIMKYPNLMKAMLQSAAGAPDSEQDSKPKTKKARK